MTHTKISILVKKHADSSQNSSLHFTGKCIQFIAGSGLIIDFLAIIFDIIFDIPSVMEIISKNIVIKSFISL